MQFGNDRSIPGGDFTWKDALGIPHFPPPTRLNASLVPDPPAANGES